MGGNLQPIRVRCTGIDLDPHIEECHRGRGAIGIRKRATVESPAGKLDPQAIEERGQPKRVNLAQWRKHHHGPRLGRRRCGHRRAMRLLRDRKGGNDHCKS
jgi:hypothetical protein